MIYWLVVTGSEKIDTIIQAEQYNSSETTHFRQTHANFPHNNNNNNNNNKTFFLDFIVFSITMIHLLVRFSL
jgi:DNA replication protein DnaD